MTDGQYYTPDLFTVRTCRPILDGLFTRLGQFVDQYASIPLERPALFSSTMLYESYVAPFTLLFGGSFVLIHLFSLLIFLHYFSTLVILLSGVVKHEHWHWHTYACASYRDHVSILGTYCLIILYTILRGCWTCVVYYGHPIALLRL